MTFHDICSKRVPPLLIGVLLSVLCSASLSQAQEQTNQTAPQPPLVMRTLDSTARQTDSRLDTKAVALQSSEIYMGELLETISKQTGVTLIVSDRYHAAGWRLCVSLNQTRLSDVMNALCSEMSYKNALWHWKREQTKEGFVYELLGSEGAEKWEETVRDGIQKNFEAEWDDAKAAMKKKDEKLGKSDPDSTADLMKREPFRRDAYGMLQEQFSDDDIKAMLHSDSMVKLSYTDLKSHGRDFVQGRIKVQNNLQVRHGQDANAGLPDYLVIQRRTAPGELTPFLFITLDNIGGGDYVGSMAEEKHWQKELRDNYLLEGDEKESSVESARLLPPVAADKAIPEEETKYRRQNGTIINQTNDSFWFRFKQLTVARLEGDPGFSFIACLPQTPENMPGRNSPYGEFLKAYRIHLDECGMVSKWHDGVLLMRYIGGVVHQESHFIPSYALVRWVRDRYPSVVKGEWQLKDLCEMAQQFPSEELGRMPGDEFAFVRSMVPSYSTYKALGKEPAILNDLLTTEGIPMAQLPQSLARHFHVSNANLSNNAMHVRIRHWRSQPPLNDFSFCFEAFLPHQGSKWEDQYAFSYVQPTDTPAKKNP